MILVLTITLAMAAGLGTAWSQEPSVPTVARLLEAQDRKRFDSELLLQGFRAIDPRVRELAFLAAGRIGDFQATNLLLTQLDEAPPSDQANIIFALGVLGDTAAVTRLEDLVGRQGYLASVALREIPSTLAKLGTESAIEFARKVMAGVPDEVTHGDREVMLPGWLLESWRFGVKAPIKEAISHTSSPDPNLRSRATYLLARTRAAIGASSLFERLTDSVAWTRQSAARGLIKSVVDSAGLAAEDVTRGLLVALKDADPGVRVNAAASLASWRDSTHAEAYEALLVDSIPNVHLAAITALRLIPGSQAEALLLLEARKMSNPTVIRSEALGALLGRSNPAADEVLGEWLGSPDVELRRAALSIAGVRSRIPIDKLLEMTDDPDPQVAVAAFNAAIGRSGEINGRLTQVSDSWRGSGDERRSGAAWVEFSARAGPAEVPELVRGLEEAIRAAQPSAVSIINALRRIYREGGGAALAVERHFLSSTKPPGDYLLRRTAQSWPELAARWGPVYPAEVRLTARQYLALAEEYLSTDSTNRPQVDILLASGGVLSLELFSDRAPITVANFLELVDGGYYDDGAWHRVVPNFVVQDGAGSPMVPRIRWAIRDEINRERYNEPVLGMALSGPDTGTSQWFINLSPQPHLDGGYTVFGRLRSGHQDLYRIIQGDRILSIRRRGA